MPLPLTRCTLKVNRAQMGQTDKRDNDFPPKITCVRNFRNSLSQKRSVFDFLECFKIISAIILGVRNFRVFEILEHLP